jgi:hypothetical protein
MVQKAFFAYPAVPTAIGATIEAAIHQTNEDGRVDRDGLGCLNNFSASISGASAGVRLPSGAAAS